jgi:hypothetical protein
MDLNTAVHALAGWLVAGLSPAHNEQLARSADQQRRSA